jgi:STE24 endopeptidase
MVPAPAPEETARARVYHRRQLALSLLGLVLSVAYLLLLIETRAAAHLVRHVAQWTTAWWLELAIVMVVLAGAYRLLTLPLQWLGGYWLPRRYGLLHQSLRRWLWDGAKATLIGAGLGLLAVVTVYALLRVTPWWWLWGAAIFLAGYTLLALVAPIWLVPLFYRLTPLPDGALRARLLALANRVGVPVTGVFVVDQSRKSRTANAAVTGLGRTRRILLFDTLLDQFTAEEIEAVLAHELGHFARGHIPRLLMVRFALALLLLAILGWLYREPAFYQALGMSEPHIGALLAGFALVMPVFTFPFQPLASLIARRQEFEADAFAAAHASATDLASALAKLYRDNASTLTPDPLHSLVYDSHPPATIRIAHLRNAAP